MSNYRGEKPVWQKRFWEHSIRDDNDHHRHMDYIHYNPVRHGYVNRPSEWKYSSFNQAASKGLYDPLWGADAPVSIKDLNYE
jgi:putative transposase